MSDQRSGRGRLGLAGAGLAAALALSACVTATPYQPATGQGFYQNGYTDQQIEPNRFQVTFAGNTVTSRETVERYLLFRAAQLTLERGYDHFILVERDTDRRSRTYSNPGWGGRGFGGFGFWGPSWRYYGGGFAGRGWSPFYGDPFWDRGVDIRTVDKYEAMAEILLGRGPKPASNVRAFDARAVIDSIGPRVAVPQDMRRR